MAGNQAVLGSLQKLSQAHGAITMQLRTTTTTLFVEASHAFGSVYISTTTSFS